MLTQLLVTVAAIAVMMTGWLGLQAWVRRSSNLGADCDMLEGRFGCVGCVLSGHCKLEDADDLSRRPRYPENTRPE